MTTTITNKYDSPYKNERDYIRHDALDDYEDELKELLQDFRYATKKLKSALMGHNHNEIADRGKDARYRLEDLMSHLERMEDLIEEVRDDEDDTEE